MAVERLIFDDNIEIPFSGGLRPAITYAINDLKNVGDRVGDYSKTITLPSSKALDKYFNHIFEINTVTLSFNPNKRTNIKYIADDEVILEGYLRLNDITINDNYKIDYKVSIFGKNTSLFSAIGEKELQDIDLSIYDHQMSVTNVQNSWDTSIIESGSPVAFSFGKGYVYPLINYGFDTNNRTYRLDHLFPAVYCKEYVDRIFEDAGKTYISNFFGSGNFKKLIIPFNGTSIAKTQTQIENSTFQADNASVSKTSQSATTIIFPNEVSDAGGVYDNTTGVFTANDSGFYNFTCVVDIEVDFTPSGNVVDAYINKFPKVTIGLKKNGSPILIATSSFFLGDETVAIPPTTTYSTGVNVAYPSDAHFTTRPSGTVTKVDNKKTNPASNLPLIVNDIPLLVGDTIEVVWYVQYVGGNYNIYPLITDKFCDLGGTTGFGGTTTFKVNSGKFFATVTNNSILELGTVPMNNCIPKNIKQKDFLKSIMNMFRLEITPHPTLTDTFIIEPYEQFYLNDVVDWTEKFDNSRDLVLEPMGLLEASEYLYKYKDDKDYYNETYKGEFNESYGQRSGLIDNDFVKQLTTTEVIFSATPIVGQEDVDLVVPTIIKNEDTVKQTESNIRILFYNGLKTTSTIWEIRSTFDWIATAYEYSEYPYAGHFNDPFNATTDINFGLPKRLYYDNTFHDITLTNNNLFNKYHLPFLKQIASRDSKLVAGHFYLKPKDIRNLSFRSVYAFKNAYYRLYKVENYDPNNEITKCLFVKLIDVNPYSVVTGTINGGAADFESGFNGGVQVEEAAPQLKSTQISNNNNADTYTKISGTNNYVNKSADFIEINGDNNQVNSFTRNINIQGNNNIIDSGVTDVTLINTNGVTVVEGGVTYVNGKLQNDNIIGINSDYIMNETDNTVINISSGIVEVTLPIQKNNSIIGILYTIKNRNGVTRILPNVGEKIDTEDFIELTNPFESKTFKLINSTNWIII